MLRTTLILMAKDLRLFVRDRVALMLAVLLPIVLVTVFGAIMSGLGGDDGGGGMPSVEATLLDQDDSEGSREFTQALAEMDGIALTMASPGTTREDLLQIIRDGDRPFAVVLPPGFADGADIQLLRDPGRSMSLQFLTIGLARALFEVRGPELAWELQERALTAAGIPPEWSSRVQAFTAPFRLAMETLFEDAKDEGYIEDGKEQAAPGEASPAEAGDKAASGFDFQPQMFEILPITAEDVLPEGRQEDISYMVAHAVSGMTVMMLMFSLVGFARSLIEEREDGTLRRLLCAPIDPRAILASKFVGSYVIGLALVVILFVYASLLFDFDIHSHWDTVLVISMVTAASTTGFALLIATVATSDKQADGLSTILILTMSALGGAWLPLMFMPPPVQVAARFTLPFWSIDAYQRCFWNGLDWTDPAILGNLGVLLGITVVLVVVAGRVFRSRYLGNSGA